MELFDPYLKTLEHEIGVQWRWAKKFINRSCSHLEPWQIVFMSVGFTILFVAFWEFFWKPNKNLWKRFKESLFSFIRNLPIIRGKIDKILQKQVKELEEMFQKTNKNLPYITKLPQSGLSKKEIFDKIYQYQNLAEIKWSEGACSGAVYSGEKELTSLLTEVYEKFAWSNPLHADVFCDVRKMEVEVVRMTCDIFNGGPETCGTMTTGGTESLLLACYAYRNMAYKKGITHPEIVLPVTAHPAFDKASHMFHMKLVSVPVDKVTLRVKVKDIKKAINKNTCMLVGSAPHYPHGIIDPIADIAKLGVQYDIPVHVDCCLGGFIVPFMKRAGYHVEPFDFSVDGVTSISADTHKYGLAPKGTSVIMYSDKKFRKFQYFVALDWPGGIYASPTIMGSRAGSSIAACWVTMMNTGLDGYVKVTQDVIGTTKYLEMKINEIGGLYALKSESSILVIGSNDFNVYRLSDHMSKKGWSLSPLQYPTLIHIAVTLIHTKEGVADRFIRDVTECTREIMKVKVTKDTGTAAIYGMAHSVPDVSLVAEVTGSYFDAYYSTQVSQ